jgi:hypothetical protein
MKTPFYFSCFFTLWDHRFHHITFGMTPSASMLHGVCSRLLRLHTLRLEAAVKSVIADFRFYLARINRKKVTSELKFEVS